MFKKFALAVIAAVFPFALLRGDMAIPRVHYRAMSLDEWRHVQGSDAIIGDNWIVLTTLALLAFVGVAAILLGMRKRKYGAILILLPMEIILLGSLVCLGWKRFQHEIEYWWLEYKLKTALSHDADRGRIEKVSPEPLESYKEYLTRVNCLEGYICLKCGTQRERRLYSWYCPKCEPSYFVCEKCGGVKVGAYYEGRYLYCTKCGAGRRGPGWTPEGWTRTQRDD